MARYAAFVLLLMLLCVLGINATDVYRVQVPTYGAGYSSAQLNATADVVLLLKELLLEVRGLRQDVKQGLEARPASPVEAPDPVKLVATRCMACHNAANPEGKLVLVEKDGTLADLSFEHRERIARRVNNGTMPPAKGPNGPIPALNGGEKVSLLGLIGPKKTPPQPTGEQK